MSEPKPWRCKECGSILGWQDEQGLNVQMDAVERYTVPSRTEEIWVTCKQCSSVQIWRARAELRSLSLGGKWRTRERPDDAGSEEPPKRRREL